MVSNVYLSQNPLFSSITLINKKCNDKNIAMVDDFKTVNIKVDADLKPDITSRATPARWSSWAGSQWSTPKKPRRRTSTLSA